ncbi:hypothetical protein [Dyella sp. ASV21]|jgi:uncharacterized protein YlxW (UPF0749 family)|uniref:hypothetical protein n=1 Tax=Dyella sp. ASV21 TaxID=2795114 RepID=UPI0018EC531D|nr:hypothetical protein [Dyella sp. ASV21]
MKHVLSGLVCGLLAIASPLRAAQVAAPSSSKSGQPARLEGAIAQEQAKVRQLQGDVGREEGKSQQADDKLKKQDQAIAELQRQLEALKKAPQGSGHP